MTLLNTKRLLIVFVIICFLSLTVLGRAQVVANGPITKDALLSTLESMQSGKSKRRNVAWYVAMLEKHKASFRATPEDEQKIRLHGQYLGKKGLDSLLKAVRDNYISTDGQQPPSTKEGEKAMPDEKSKSQEPPRSISQSITNSPGSAAVIGDNNTVNLGPQPRRITVGQAEKIIPVLRAHPPHSITVIRILNDKEAETYALQIAQVLINAGWQVDIDGIGMLMPPTYGIECRIKDADKAATICSLLQEAFGVVGIKIIPNPNAADELFPAAILVGLRP